MRAGSRGSNRENPTDQVGSHDGIPIGLERLEVRDDRGKCTMILARWMKTDQGELIFLGLNEELIDSAKQFMLQEPL